MLVTKLRKTKKKWKKGFTLVELLVAITISTLIGLSVFMITNSASNVFARGTESIVADDVKDTLVAFVKDKLYTRSDLYLVKNSFTEGGLTGENIKKYHAMFVYDGYVYIVESNLEGEIEVDDNNIPVNKRMLIAQSAYDKYKVNMSFVPLGSDENGYTTLRLNIYVYDENNQVVCKSYESFKMVNMQYNQVNISFEQDAEGNAYDAYFMCYFV